MKRKIIICSSMIFSILILFPFIIGDSILNKISSSVSIISNVASFITVIIALLLYDKFGIDKSIKDKNLKASLDLLEQIKKTFITIQGDKFMINYRPTVFAMQWYEDSYSKELIFSSSYSSDISFLTNFSDNLYLPKEIKLKLDELLPFSMTQTSEDIKMSDFGKVSIGQPKDVEWKFDIINNEKVTLYDYLFKWDDLITTIQDWCNKHSDSKIDLNIQ